MTQRRMPHEMLAHTLATTDPVTPKIETIIAPILGARTALREHLTSEGFLRRLPENPEPGVIGCVDGAMVTSSLAIGDHHTTLSVAIQSENNAQHVAGSRSWTQFQPHHASSDALTKAVMLTHEAELLPELRADGVRLLDGSHTTAITAITDLLNTGERDDVRAFLDVFDSEKLSSIISTVITDRSVFAAQKQDSSTSLWEALNGTEKIGGAGLPDKPLASLLLQPGEYMCHPATRPAWERVHRAVHNAPGGSLRAHLRDLIEPVATGHQVRVTLVKPPHATFALRIEHKPLTHAELDAALRVIVADTAPPHVHEPVVQHMADKIAKSVSSLSALHLETARRDTLNSSHPELLPHLLHSYRTT